MVCAFSAFLALVSRFSLIFYHRQTSQQRLVWAHGTMRFPETPVRSFIGTIGICTCLSPSLPRSPYRPVAFYFQPSEKNSANSHGLGVLHAWPRRGERGFCDPAEGEMRFPGVQDWGGRGYLAGSAFLSRTNAVSWVGFWQACKRRGWNPQARRQPQ